MIINVLEYLEYSAQQFPQKIALSDETGSVTYCQYEQRAKEIGTYIAEKTSARNRPIMVLIDRNISSVICFMGILYSGNFYVPLDITLPEERKRNILSELKPAMVLDALEHGKSWKINDPDCPWIAVDSIPAATNESLLQAIRDTHIDTDPLYALFTSGSTGVPKGVLISHRSMIDLVEQFAVTFDWDENCIFGNQAPYDFDVSAKDIYNSLRIGASLVVIPTRLFMTPVLLVDYLDQHKINTLIWAVSAMRIVADFRTFESYRCCDHAIRYILFSGEVMPPKTLQYWMKFVPDAMYVNVYGPTEITCNCTYHIIDTIPQDDAPIPIGRPFRNSRVLLLKDDGEIIDRADEEGEICVEGSSLGLGYWNNPEQTNKSFLNRVDVPEYPCRIYHTGDMGYYDEKKDIIFSSRKDYQIKHMGHRIELGEIELAINSLPGIRVCCCVYLEQEEKIICWYEGENSDKKEIVHGLMKTLPKYMWPNRYIHMEHLPLNAHGKIDRRGLKNGDYNA